MCPTFWFYTNCKSYIKKEKQVKVDQEKLNSYLKRIKASPCTLCGNNNWSVSDTIFQALEFDAGGLRLGGTDSYPIIPITCSKCGNTIFINALVAGLVDQNESDDGGNNGENDSNI